MHDIWGSPSPEQALRIPHAEVKLSDEVIFERRKVTDETKQQKISLDAVLPAETVRMKRKI